MFRNNHIMGVMFNMSIYLRPCTILHKFTCLPVVRQSPCKKKTVNRGQQPSPALFQGSCVKSWLLKQRIHAHHCSLIQTRTLYLNSDDFQSKHPACIISACLYSNPRAGFFTGSLELHFPLPIMFEWQDRMCYKLPVANRQLQWSISSRDNTCEIWNRGNRTHFTSSSDIFCRQDTCFMCCGCFCLVYEHRAHENHWLVCEETS